MLRARTRDDAAVGDAQCDGVDVTAEAAVNVVVLPVDVGCHHAAQRHKARARRHRREPPLGQKRPVQLVQRQAGFRGHVARLGVEAQDAIGERAARNARVAGRGERSIAVGTAQPARERDVKSDRLQVLRPDLIARHHRNTAPPRQTMVAGRCRLLTLHFH